MAYDNQRWMLEKDPNGLKNENDNRNSITFFDYSVKDPCAPVQTQTEAESIHKMLNLYC